jgi:hypothetical protein
MTDPGLREQIAAAIREHTPRVDEIVDGFRCDGCDWDGSDRLADHDRHVADAVVTVLNLREQWGVQELDKTEGAFGTWHETRETAERHCETIRGNWRRNESFRRSEPNEPSPQPVRRWVSGWSVVAGDK